MKATIYTADDREIIATPKNGSDFSLEELNTIVDGYIEILFSLDGKKLMILNEEGKLNDLPYNIVATDIAKKEFGLIGDYIVGNVLVCDKGMVK